LQSGDGEHKKKKKRPNYDTQTILSRKINKSVLFLHGKTNRYGS
jgi:hypothetical protein